MTEPVDEFAMSWLFGLAAGIEGGPQDTLDMPQILHSLLDIKEAVLDKALDVPARRGRGVVVAEHQGDIIEGEARRLSRPDEPYPLRPDGLTRPTRS
jgi:hypothetical protein